MAAFLIFCLLILAYIYNADVRFAGAYYLHLPTSYVVRSSSMTAEKFTYSGLNHRRVTFAIPRAYLPLLWDQHAEKFSQLNFSAIEVVAEISATEISLLPYSYGLRGKFDGPNAEEINIEVRDAPPLLRHIEDATQLLQKKYLDRLEGLPRQQLSADGAVWEVSGVAEKTGVPTPGMQERSRWFIVTADKDAPWVVSCSSLLFTDTGSASRWRCGGRFVDSNGLEVILTFPLSQIAEVPRLKDTVLALLSRLTVAG